MEGDDREHLGVVVEATPIAIIVLDDRGHIALANEHAQLMFGYSADELRDRDVALLVPERFRAEYLTFCSEYSRAPASRPMNAGHSLFGLRKDGTEVPLDVGLNPVRTRNGSFVLAAIIDVTERIQSEERRHSAEQMHLVIDGAANAMIATDGEGHITLVNSQVERMFGYLRQELLGSSIEMLPELMRNYADELRRNTASHVALLNDINAEKHDVEVSLGEVAGHVRQQAKRQEALWRIVNTPSLRGDDLVHAMLREAALAVRPGQAYFGTLGHIEGSTYVLDATSDDDAHRFLQVGLRTEVSNLLLARDLKGGRTQSWQDCQLDTELPTTAREIGLRSQIATQFSANETLYVLALASLEPPSENRFCAEDYEYIEVLGSFFARYLEQTRLEKSLRVAESRARQHAERLAALWQVANNPELRGKDLILAMLRQAAAAIRPGQRFHGLLGRIDGNEVVVVGVGAEAGTDEPISQVRVGRRTPLDKTIVPSGSRTRCWDDLAALKTAPAGLAFLRWRAVLSTQFEAGDMRYWLVFGSPEPAAIPFDEEDFAYVDLLASSFADHMQVSQLEVSLRDAEARSRFHAERLEALWQIANDPKLEGQELMLAMLRHVALTMHPDQPSCGLLGRLEGSDVVLIGVGGVAFAGHTALRIGSRAPIDQTSITSVSRTRCWNDFSTSEDAPPGLAALGWRAAISTQFEAGGARYLLTFGSSKPAAAPFNDDDFAYLDVLVSSFANRLQVSQLKGSLRDEEDRSRQHADRLDALRKIVNNPTLHDQELLLAMLGQAAAAIRPGQNYRAVLWSVQGTELVVECVACAMPPMDDTFPAIGASIPVAQTVIGRVVSAGRGTRSWDDFLASKELSPLARANSTRSLIVTTFNAGATDWGLSFASAEATREPWGPQDHAYIEVLASFFANHVQQRWQFERIQYQQSHDVLTGLLSRSQFRSQARAAARTNAHYAIILVNIDGFREINESRGHMIGDAVLVEVGNALRKRAGGDEIVGRIEGDVFGIYLPNPVSSEAVHERAADFADVFSTPFPTGDRDGTDAISRTGTLGVAIAPDDGTMIDAVLSHAGTALIKAKERGRGSMVFYETGMEGDAQRRAALRNELAIAVAQNQFTLYYQPHVEIATGNISGCEALIRWNHPTRGLLLPSAFIPFAEQSGIITSIDNWVMQNAFAAANELASLRPGFRVYFNLSGRQASDPKVIHTFTTAARNGVELSNIGVEITESDAMRDVELTRHVCRALRRLNVRIAIDDFGTGYSSLSLLKRLPVDILKIDQSFVSGILKDRHDATIAETIISMTKHFDFACLAEGVECVEEMEWLKQRSCRYMQGFAICAPLTFDAFKAWLAAHPEGFRHTDRRVAGAMAKAVAGEA